MTSTDNPAGPKLDMLEPAPEPRPHHRASVRIETIF